MPKTPLTYSHKESQSNSTEPNRICTLQVMVMITQPSLQCDRCANWRFVLAVLVGVVFISLFNEWHTTRQLHIHTRQLGLSHCRYKIESDRPADGRKNEPSFTTKQRLFSNKEMFNIRRRSRVWLCAWVLCLQTQAGQISLLPKMWVATDWSDVDCGNRYDNNYNVKKKFWNLEIHTDKN